MALTDSDLQQVQGFVQTHISEWLPHPVLQLGERIVRVEEELKHQRELMQQGFARIDKRFEKLQSHSDRRFEEMRRTRDR